MRKVVFQAHADTVGTDTASLVVFEPNEDGSEVTDKYLDDYADQFGMEHWNMYEPSYNEEDFETYDDFLDDYYEQCGSWWEEYNPKEHNGLLTGEEDGYEESD